MDDTQLPLSSACMPMDSEPQAEHAELTPFELSQSINSCRVMVDESNNRAPSQAQSMIFVF